MGAMRDSLPEIRKLPFVRTAACQETGKGCRNGLDTVSQFPKNPAARARPAESACRFSADPSPPRGKDSICDFLAATH